MSASDDILWMHAVAMIWLRYIQAFGDDGLAVGHGLLWGVLGLDRFPPIKHLSVNDEVVEFSIPKPLQASPDSQTSNTS